MKCGGETKNVHYLYEGKSILFQVRLLKILSELRRKLKLFYIYSPKQQLKAETSWSIYYDNPFRLNIGTFMKTWASLSFSACWLETNSSIIFCILFKIISLTVSDLSSLYHRNLVHILFASIYVERICSSFLLYYTDLSLYFY